MAGINGFTNSFTSGELCDDVWDRTDIQPVLKGCERAQNLNIRIAGPLGKRRGFWLNAPVNDQTKAARMIPFRRSPQDALVLLFQDNVAWVYQTNGQPLISGMAQVSFVTPFTAAQVAGLRYKQVGDVIYFYHAAGIEPEILTRHDNLTWTWQVPTLKNGPWLAENIDRALTLTFTGTDESDANTITAAGSILTGQTVSIAASSALFTNAMVGSQLRVRPGAAASSVRAWTAGQHTPVGWYALFNGNVYIATADDGTDKDAQTPPVTTTPGEPQSDGNSVFEWRHDGSGIVLITAVADSTHATGTVVSTLPLKSAQATSYWAKAAYSPLNGWPTAWPEIREERLATGGTSSNLDWIDLTQTAGFDATQLDYTPGTGTGQVVDTNAIRRRVGVDGGQALWLSTATYLVCGTAGGEYLVAGSVLDEPLSPEGVTVKELSTFGCAPVLPQKAHKGLLFVTKSFQCLRELTVDTQQGASGEDHSFLATHLAKRGFAQLAWVPDPDNHLWVRLADAGFCAFTYHAEQQVKGWTSQQLGGAVVATDAIVMPGPGDLDTLWLLASQTVLGVTKTYILMQSQETDGLFMDCALAYVGAATNVLAGIPAAFNGQKLDVLSGDGLAGGTWYPGLTVAGGAVTLPDGATTMRAQVGFTFPIYFKTLKLDLRVFNGTLLTKQRVASALCDVKGLFWTIALDDGEGEEVDYRQWQDVATVKPRRKVKAHGLVRDTDTEDQDRDPRIVIQEQTPFDFVIYAIREDDIALGG